MCEIQLLGNSQTFIGVLATIVVLCVVTGSSNFLYNILESYAKPTRENIKNFKGELEKQTSLLIKADSHKKFLNFIKSINDNPIHSSSLNDIANQYKVLHKISLNEFTGRYNGTYLVPFENRSNDICNSREQTFAPLFVFAYCILVFIFDGIVSWFPSTLSQILSVIAIFTLLSTFFLIGIWFKFYSEFYSVSSHKDEKDRHTEPIRISKTTIIKTFFLKALFPTVFTVICLWIIDSVIIHIHTLIIRTLIGISIVLPLCVLGWKHIKIRTSFGKYSHSFLLWHFGCVLVLSVSYTILLFLPFDYLISAKIPYSDKQWEIQCAIIAFIIIFGLILPFAIPYHCYKNIYDHSIVVYKSSWDSMSIESKTIESNIEDYIRDLREWIDLEKEIDYEQFSGLDCCFEIMSENIKREAFV